MYPDVSIEQKDMTTLTVPANQLLAVCQWLRDHPDFLFNQLSDLCAIDYSEYGYANWRTQSPTYSGYDRAVSTMQPVIKHNLPHFAVVIHLLSHQSCLRMRLKVPLPDEPYQLPSVTRIWPSANWYEREAFDLFGVVFEGHPDLRRILTDYGFKGHPFRRNFPLIGEVEMRYDAKAQRCVYEPVSIEPRVLVPRVIRDAASAESNSERVSDE